MPTKTDPDLQFFAMLDSIDTSEFDEIELEHSGRKGMKWYQHIFGDYQDHARYAVKGTTTNKKLKQAQREQRKRDKAAKKEANRVKKAEEKQAKTEQKNQNDQTKRRELAKKDLKVLAKMRDSFSDEELNEIYRGFEWDRKIADLRSANYERAKKNVANTLGLLTSGIGIYNNVALIYNNLNPNEGQLPYLSKDKKKPEKKDEKKD